MASVRGVKHPSSDATEEKLWLHFTLWSRPSHRWTYTHMQGLAVTSSHSHHLLGFNKLTGCSRLPEGALNTQVVLADGMRRHPAKSGLSRQSGSQQPKPLHCHPDSLRKGKHRMNQGRWQDSTCPLVGLAPKTLVPMAFVTLPSSFSSVKWG